MQTPTPPEAAGQPANPDPGPAPAISPDAIDALATGMRRHHGARVVVAVTLSVCATLAMLMALEYYAHPCQASTQVAAAAASAAPAPTAMGGR